MPGRRAYYATISVQQATNRPTDRPKAMKGPTGSNEVNRYTIFSV